MFVTNEEFALVKQWTRSMTGSGSNTYNYLKQSLPDNQAIMFIDIDSVKLSKTSENGVRISVFMAVTEEGFPAFKGIYNEVKSSILHPLDLSVHFINKTVHQKSKPDASFVFTMATISYEVNTNTKQYSQMLIEQYITALSKAFQTAIN
jgi:hypothetical protein